MDFDKILADLDSEDCATQDDCATCPYGNECLGV